MFVLLTIASDLQIKQHIFLLLSVKEGALWTLGCNWSNVAI